MLEKSKKGLLVDVRIIMMNFLRDLSKLVLTHKAQGVAIVGEAGEEL